MMPAAARGWTALALAAAAVALAAHVLLLWGATTPVFPYDEVTLLQMSRLLAGQDHSLVIGAGYFPGWALVIAPLWWFTSTPTTLYMASLVVGLVVSAATVLPLAALVRRVGLARSQAYAVACVVLAMPAVAVQAAFSLSERLLLLAVVCLALAVQRLHERPTPARATMLALAATATYLVHLRALALVAVTLVWLVLLLRRDRRSAATGLAVLVVAGLAVHGLGVALNLAVMDAVPTQGTGLLAALSDPAPLLMLRVLASQLWAQLVGTFGLVAVGAVAVAQAAWGAARRRRPDPALWLAGAIVASVLVSVLSWADPAVLYAEDWRRLDGWIYGRYLDPVATLVVALALALLIRRVPGRVHAWAAAAGALIVTATLLAAAPYASTWGYVTVAHVPGLAPWLGLLPAERFDEGLHLLPTLGNANRMWLWASLATAAAFALVLALRRRPLAAVALAGLLATAASVASDPATDRFHASEGRVPAPVAETRAVLAEHPETRVAYVTGCAPSAGRGPVSRNYFGWWLVPAVMEGVADGSPDLARYDLYVACEGWPGASSLDATPVPGSLAYGSELWVRPGPVADGLRVPDPSR